MYSIKNSMRLIVDSGEDELSKTVYTNQESSTQDRRPRTPRVAAGDKPRLKTASHVSNPAISLNGVASDGAAGVGTFVESSGLTHVPLKELAAKLNAARHMGGNILDGPFCFNKEAAGVSEKPGAPVPASVSAVSEHGKEYETRSNSSSRSHDLNSSFRQFMVAKLRAAHVEGKQVDAANMKVVAPVGQTLAMHATEEQSHATHDEDVHRPLVRRRKSIVGFENDATDIANTSCASPSVRGESPCTLKTEPATKCLSEVLQSSEKAPEELESRLGTCAPPEGDAIGIDLVRPSASSANGTSQCGTCEVHSKSGISHVTSTKRLCDGVLHTFVANRVERTGTENFRQQQEPEETMECLLSKQVREEDEAAAASAKGVCALLQDATLLTTISRFVVNLCRQKKL